MNCYLLANPFDGIHHAAFRLWTVRPTWIAIKNWLKNRRSIIRRQPVPYEPALNDIRHAHGCESARSMSDPELPGTLL